MIDDAVALGWELIPYEDTRAPDPHREDGSIDHGHVNARERGQAENLAAALPQTPLLVWCGNSHLSKRSGDEFTPMGLLFRELSGIDHVALDQTVTVFARLGLVEHLRASSSRSAGRPGC